MHVLKKLHERIDKEARKETMFLESKLQHRLTMLVRKAVKEQLLKKYKQVEKAKIELRCFFNPYERTQVFNKIESVFNDLYES